MLSDVEWNSEHELGDFVDHSRLARARALDDGRMAQVLAFLRAGSKGMFVHALQVDQQDIV